MNMKSNCGITLEDSTQDSSKLLSILTTTLNSASTLNYTLSSLLSNHFPRDQYEVLVIDGGSTDNTLDVCRRFSVKVFPCLKKGWGAALNLGIEKARGDIVCIVDSDVVVPDDWLIRIWEFFHDHPEVEGVGGPNFPPSHYRNSIQRFTGEIFVEDQMFPDKLTKSQYMRMWDGGLVCGPAYAYRRKTLLHAGGFNESLKSYSDIDLCWRLIKMGKHLVFNPELKVAHLGFPSTITGVIKQQFKWGKGRGQVNKLHRSNNFVDDSKREAYSFFQILKAILLLFSPTHFPKTKQLLKCIHYISFHLGRIYGR